MKGLLAQALAARTTSCADEHVTGELYAGLCQAAVLAGDLPTARRWLARLQRSTRQAITDQAGARLK